mmetsp:Transcript_5484/g.13760  ORF Transcript_5484/g.13760 Transcript_5484/m.13760 type:complete len:338 (-) Transcript_5484:293-1306(-)|eukprot:CAMPEP_0197196270 /NCGR_PEP_ID=MMETSP1423-20130617/32264_1 /TAXON_ID=476441 /ORGANISM="Pseudo-nitzschia heimii, Strain UNC1101" /LENGTH=337 /DNA_ID=CAMNT_0042650055 /DNA_START=90 /DNA_END=1103 /DNA_ORIENTATION=+
MTYRPVNIIKLFVYFIVTTRWSELTALQDFDERNELEVGRNSESYNGKSVRQLRRNLNRHSSQYIINRYDESVRPIDDLNRPVQTNIELREDFDQLEQEHSTQSSLISREPGAHRFSDEEPDQTSIQICRKVRLNFAKAANGRGMSGGEFVRDEWFHGYGINIYAEGHDGKNNLHPMIFDSSDVNRNGALSDEDVLALGSPNFDCGGIGEGIGGKEGKQGENCKSLGNLLIPSRKPGSPILNSISRGRLYKRPLGGVLIFQFSKKTKIDNIGFLNIGETDQIMVVYNDGGLQKIELASVGRNGFQNIPIGAEDVQRLYVNLHSFGAVTGLALCIDVD